MDGDKRRTTRSRGSLDSGIEMNEFAAAREARRRGRRWKRPSRILGIWARLALLAALIVTLVFMAVGLVSKAARPYREAGIQSSQLADARQESDALVQENTVLACHIAYLKTPEGIASEARKMGYLRPGEIPIVVEGGVGQTALSDAAPEPATAPAVSHSSSGGAARRFWRHLTGH